MLYLLGGLPTYVDIVLEFLSYSLLSPWALKKSSFKMSGREVRDVSRVIEDMEIHQADGNLRQRTSLPRRWSESDDEYSARMHNGYSHPAESRQDGVHQGTTFIPDPYGGPYLPPPPYHERDDDLGGGDTLPNYLFNIYPSGGRRSDYVTDSSGRWERYNTDERGKRVAWPLPDFVDISDDDEDSDVVHLESGRVIPRSQWEADYQWEASSEEPSDGTDKEFFQPQRSPMPQTRTSAHLTSEREGHDREVARIRNGYSVGARPRRRESHPRYGEVFHHMARERRRHRDRRPASLTHHLNS